MTPVLIFSLSLIVLTIGAQYFLRPFSIYSGSIYLRWLTFVGASGLIAFLSYNTALQYLAWATGGSVTRFLLPPYNTIGYFLFYSFTEFWANYLIAAALGAIGYFAIRNYNHRHKEMLFYPEESLLCFLAFLMVGHPLWILYLILLLLAVLLGTLYTHLISKTRARVSFYYLWLPLALLTLILSPMLERLNFIIYLSL
ncbi:MAG: hypothetical protein Q7R62_02820 [bacterium]|nr:hypothetical protein [bacterium]